MKRPRLIAGIAVAALIAAALWLGARPAAESLTRPVVPKDASAATRGAAAFEGAGFGGVSLDALSSNAVPWRIAAAALVLDERARDPSAPLDATTLDRVLRRFGFLDSAVVVNRAGVRAHDVGMPLGFTTGDVAPVGGSVIRVANLGCAACHAGVTYGAEGQPLPDRVMLGMPNTSVDLEAYTAAIFQALRRFAASDELLPAVDAIFPKLDWRERASLSALVLPLARQRLDTLAGVDRPMPFPNGGPGSTNGVPALKVALGVALLGGGQGEAGVVSIPDLGDRVWRTSLLADGAYAVPGKPRQSPVTADMIDDAHLRSLAAITTFFTVPSMGVHPDKAIANLDDAADVMAFLKAYRPQGFPGPIDRVRTTAGSRIYQAECATCHGSYDDASSRLVQFPNWRGDVGTDPLRASAFDRGLADAVTRTAYRDIIASAPGAGYVAPPLTGIWASAPYLHNGSVPTLAAMLSPETRPQRFMVGGHALDLVRVGLRLDMDGAYPRDYRPFSQPAWTDTSTPGHNKEGHVFGETLSPADKLALIEFLKLL